jgi:hypothetical protein
MSVMKWMARKGNVGGTARWAADLYKRVVAENPDMHTIDIYKTMIRHRMRVLPNPSQESLLLDLTEEARGLRGLVVAILIVEAGYGENSPEHRREFSEVIEEELEKYGFSHEVIYGF